VAPEANGGGGSAATSNGDGWRSKASWRGHTHARRRPVAFYRRLAPLLRRHDGSARGPGTATCGAPAGGRHGGDLARVAQGATSRGLGSPVLGPCVASGCGASVRAASGARSAGQTSKGGGVPRGRRTRTGATRWSAMLRDMPVFFSFNTV
jgi:hypothetical protein